MTIPEGGELRAEAFEALMGRLELRRRLAAYLRGLLAPIKRKNSWQLAEAADDRTPDGVQEFLSRVRWDADAVRDDLRAYVGEHPGDPGGIPVLDETASSRRAQVADPGELAFYLTHACHGTALADLVEVAASKQASIVQRLPATRTRSTTAVPSARSRRSSSAWSRSPSRIRRFLGFISDRMQAATAAPFVERLDIRTPSLQQRVGNLSGGNQQKVSVAKWLAASSKVLIVDEPTVGIDIRSKAYLHDLIIRLSRDGAAVIVISSDMPEIVALADRIVVMNGFRIIGDMPNSRDYGPMSRAIMSLIHGLDAVAA